MDYLENQNHVYGSYKVNNIDFNGFYAGPWSAWYDNNGVKGAYRGLLFCVETTVSEPGGGNLHLHPYDAYDTDNYVPPNGNVFGMKWAAYLLHNVTPTLASSEKNRAALQLAMWEAINDGSSTYAFNLRDFGINRGKFYVKGNLGYWGGVGFGGAGFSSNDVFNQAAYYLSTYQGQGRARWLHDGQDQMEDLRDVPEPGSLMLLGGALLGPALLALKRRRSA